MFAIFVSMSLIVYTTLS